MRGVKRMKNTQVSVRKRRQKIFQVVSEKGEITIREIAQLYNVSEMTVRRDLQIMETRQLIRRTHGGVVSLARINESVRFNDDVKRCRDSISKYAARYVEDGDTLFINGSMIALNMLKYVTDKKISVYTNNGWAIGEEYPKGVTVHLTGGEIRNRILIGDYVMRNLLSITVDKIFIGCAAVYDDGEFRYDIPTEIGINESMISRTKNKVYVLADNTKLQKREEKENLYGSSTYDKPIVLITDDKANPTVLENLRQHGIEIVKV